MEGKSNTLVCEENFTFYKTIWNFLYPLVLGFVI